MLTVAAPGVLVNDTDPNGDPLTAVLVRVPAHGTLVLNANGSFTYTPALNYNGSDNFTYKVFDGSLYSGVVLVAIVITAVNDAPVAANDSYTTVKDTPLTVAAPGVLANDADVEGSALTAKLATTPAHGTVLLSSNGGFTYTPVAGYAGADSFTYKANDGTLDSVPATVSLTVTGTANTPPVANGQSVSTAEDTAAAITLTATDADGNPLTYSVDSAPAHGALSGTAPSLTYSPAADYNGPDSFTFKANDGSVDSNIATVAITVTPVNDAPVAANNSYTTTVNTALTVAAPGVLGNDTDVDSATLTTVLVTGPAHGTLTLNANGSFTFTPAAAYTGADSFTYKANDGALDSNVATVSLTISAGNQAPTAKSDGYAAKLNTLLVVAAPGVLTNDTDLNGDPLTAVLVRAPYNGTLILNSNGSFTYQPNAGYLGTDTFTYKAYDGALYSGVVGVAIAVR